MHAFHLMVRETEKSDMQRVDFEADGPDHAFQIARNECRGTHIELWDGETLLARMSRMNSNVWKLLPLSSEEPAGGSAASGNEQADRH